MNYLTCQAKIFNVLKIKKLNVTLQVFNVDKNAYTYTCILSLLTNEYQYLTKTT